MASSDSTFFLVNVSTAKGPKVFAKISPQDAQLILQYKWRFTTSSKGRVHQVSRYAVAQEKRDGKLVITKMHRLILNAPDGVHVDHINGDGLDNRRENLRLATPELNQANARKHLVGRSRFKGVSWSEAAQKWRAYISQHRKQTHLGLFNTEIEAAAAYDAKAKEIWGDRAFLNLS